MGTQPHLYFANDDLEYQVYLILTLMATVIFYFSIKLDFVLIWCHQRQATFPTERLGMGAFRIALESIYNR